MIGGSRDENVGVSFESPDAKVSYQYYHDPQNNPLICQGYGGTTTTGETARKIFQSSVLRERLVDLCPPIYQQAMSQILLNDLTLLTLMSCDKLLNVSKIGKLDLPIHIQRTCANSRCDYSLLILDPGSGSHQPCTSCMLISHS